MAEVTIIWDDNGECRVQAHTPEEADQLREKDVDVKYIEDDVLNAWEAHRQMHTAWKAMWRMVENEADAKRELRNLRWEKDERTP